MATTTFYPEAGGGGENTTCDGRMSVSNLTTWDLVHDNDGTDAIISYTETTQFPALTLKVSATSWYIYRGIFTFDTSFIGTDEISAASFSFYDNEAGLASSDADSDSFVITSSSPANSNIVVNGDFDSLGTTAFSSLVISSKTDNAYNEMVLNAAGIANINKTGVSDFGTRMETDRSDTPPTGRNQVSLFFADETGTTKDPKLVVTHGGAAPVTFTPKVTIF